jgi:hypothetical protein
VSHAFDGGRDDLEAFRQIADTTGLAAEYFADDEHASSSWLIGNDAGGIAEALRR